ncbi:MAG: hypothetical protein ACRDG8_01950 [Actinomycetota bacterium]
MRGADGDPHQVRLDDARAVELAGHGSVPMGITASTLEVAPNRDLFVPFEFAIAERTPGWYAIECEVAIDGAPETVRPGARFAVAWPRGATRRETVRVGASVVTGDGKVRLDVLECRGDSVELRYEGPETTIGLAADGRRLPVLDATFDEGSGTGTVVAYPVLKAHALVTISVRGADDLVEVRLP